MSGHTLLGKHWGAGAGPGWLTQLSASSVAAGELKALWNKQLVALLLHRVEGDPALVPSSALGIAVLGVGIDGGGGPV